MKAFGSIMLKGLGMLFHGIGKASSYIGDLCDKGSAHLSKPSEDSTQS